MLQSDTMKLFFYVILGYITKFLAQCSEVFKWVLNLMQGGIWMDLNLAEFSCFQH